MKEEKYNFPADKNEWLKKYRHISFEQVIVAIKNGGMLDIVLHPNLAKYPNQSMYILTSNEYVYLVPFMRESEMSIFLKTMFKRK